MTLRIQNKALLCLTCDGRGQCHSPTNSRTLESALDRNICRQSWISRAMTRRGEAIHHGCTLGRDHDEDCRCQCGRVRP